MRNLIFLFVKHGGLVTFLLLEMVCMFLVVNNNKEQEAIFYTSFSSASDYTTDKFNNLWQFLSLSSTNDSLARENSRLLQERDNALFIQKITKDTSDRSEKEQLFTYITAKVISNSVNLNNNSLTINRGTNHGIHPSMGIIGAGESGVVGVVKSSTRNYSRVLPILHGDSKISASIKRNGFYGSLVWRGGSPKKANLMDVPKHADLVKGDTIQTSGYSTLFPESIMIGTIDTFWLQEGTNFYDIEVNLINDLSRVKYVYVIDNLMKEELEQLEKEVSDE